MRGDVTDAGQPNNDKQLKIELLSEWKLEAESRNFHFKSFLQGVLPHNLDSMAVFSLLNPNIICQTFCLFPKTTIVQITCTLSNALYCNANSLGIPLEVLNDEVEAGAQLQEGLVLPREEPPLVIHCPNHHLGNR